MASEYILPDRTIANNQSVQVDDGQLKWTETADAANAEPIFEDNTNPGTYWKMFIDDGQIAIESTVTVQDDVVQLEDLTTAQLWTFEVNDGQLAINDGISLVAIGGPLPWKRRRR